ARGSADGAERRLARSASGRRGRQEKRGAWMLLGRVVAAGVAIGAGVLAYRAGGGAEAPAALPRPEPVNASATIDPRGRAIAGDTYEVAVRLVEIAKYARVEGGGDKSAQAIFASHWRKMKPPFAPASPVVWSVALRTSAT